LGFERKKSAEIAAEEAASVGLSGPSLWLM
jgi:hypothetical protein